MKVKAKQSCGGLYATRQKQIEPSVATRLATLSRNDRLAWLTGVLTTSPKGWTSGPDRLFSGVKGCALWRMVRCEQHVESKQT